MGAPFCIDCRHCKVSTPFFYCRRPAPKLMVSPDMPVHRGNCAGQRRKVGIVARLQGVDLCGPEGKYFQSLPTRTRLEPRPLIDDPEGMN